MTLEEFKAWAAERADGVDRVSDEASSGIALHPEGLAEMLTRAFLMGSGCSSGVIDLLQWQERKIDALRAGFEELRRSTAPPRQDIVLETMAQAVTQLHERVDALEKQRAALNEHIRVVSDFSERFQGSGYSVDGDIVTISSPVYVVKDGIDH